MKRSSKVWNFSKSLLLSLMIVFSLNKWIAKPVVVVGDSMYPTLQEDQRGLSNVLSVTLEPLHRFDIVVVDTPQYGLIVKRIIALPFETIEYKNDTLYINQKKIAEDFLNQDYVNQFKAMGFTQDIKPLTLKKDHYFVMGDNRPFSDDSRGVIGPISRQQIVSKDMLVLYPLNHIGYKGRLK